MKKDDIYAIGFPAEKAYESFIHLVMDQANPTDSLLDLGGGQGAYSVELMRRGFKCINADLNMDYLLKSRCHGVESCAMSATSLGFKDKSFDVVLLFETLEHIANCNEVLEEAKRVTRKRILITVPNSGGHQLLKSQRLTYDHFLATDHLNFFDKKDLESLLSKHFDNFMVVEMEPMSIKLDLTSLTSHRWIHRSIGALVRLGLIGPNAICGLGVCYRLYGIVDIA